MSDHIHSRFGRLRLKVREALHRARGVSLELDLDEKRQTVGRIHEFHRAQGLTGLADGRLALAAAGLGARIGGGPPTAESTVEAFALTFEACRRAFGLTPHDVQLIAGLAMAEGKIAELATGEGKTLAAVFPACLFALSGQSVQVLTFNDYLARRDAAWMGPAYRLLGLSVGVVQEGLDRPRKRDAYAAAVTYGTAKEAGFDFLRDQLAYDKADRVHRPFGVALVDEADSILIDEARVPLIIAATAGEAGTEAARLAPLVRALTPGHDYEADAERRNVFPTETGLAEIERRLGLDNIHAPGNEPWLAAVHCALHAEALLERDVDYIVRNGRIEIVDEFTGRVMDKRHWPDGLQAAVEAKEGVSGSPAGRVLGSLTLQHYFRLYPRLCGMTATAADSAAEFKEFYGLGVVVIPPHRPCRRRDLPDAVFFGKEEKLRALAAEISSVHAAGRPILVGTLNVKESEELAEALRQAGLRAEVLNARNDELEAAVIAEAGAPGAITISTNMAGRGTDIRLGGTAEAHRDRVAGLGGLYVIGTNRHESRRIDRQLRGRAGRQGDPGSSRLFISLEDEIFERHGLKERLLKRYRPGAGGGGGALDGPAVRTEIGHAQRVIEGRNFEICRSLWAYSQLVEKQRRIVHKERDSILEAAEGAGWLRRPAAAILAAGAARFGREEWARIRRRASLQGLDEGWADHLAELADIRERVHLVSLAGRDPVAEFAREAARVFDETAARSARAIGRKLGAIIRQDGRIDLEAQGLVGPSSTWTYLVDNQELEWGVALLKGKNIGLSAGAAAFLGPLFLLTLILRRRRRRTGPSA